MRKSNKEVSKITLVLYGTIGLQRLGESCEIGNYLDHDLNFVCMVSALLQDEHAKCGRGPPAALDTLS